MPVSFDEPQMLWAALALMVVAALVVMLRRPAVPAITLGFVGVGLIFLGSRWQRGVQS